MNKFLKSNYIFLLFLIPLFPHIDLNLEWIHFDDLPIVIYFFLFFIYSLKKITIYDLKNATPILVFIIFISFQNIFFYNNFFNTEILRYILYLVIFLHFKTIESDNKLFLNLPIYLFYFLSCFSIFSYFLQLNLGTDAYNYWNIGLNNNEWGFTPGRVNGFQAGGPNSFGDLICILGLYSLTSVKNSIKPIIVVLSFLSCFFTYSRSSLLVLTFFMLIILLQKFDMRNVLALVLSILFVLNFGLIERFSSEKETEGILDRIEMQTATAGYLSNQNLPSFLFGSGFNNVGVVNDSVGSIENFDESLRVTGPHNSYLFFILKYGLIGFVLYLWIFKKFIKMLINQNLKFLINDTLSLCIVSFLILGFASDLLHNHTVSWLLYYLLFDRNE
ncbi:MAG: O-antigen ligase family protein [Candidatus Actinomarina sp.]|tara:strand:+ start:93 stop:1256 length:1164 start_codon:yes stop_codon:yes gene_type:complete